MKFNRIIENNIVLIFAVLILTLFSAGSGMCGEPKKIAVLPFTMNSPDDLGFLQNGLFDMLSTRLADPGNVEVLDRETIDKAMEKAKISHKIKGQFNESKARILGGIMGVDYILFGSLTHFGESVSLDTSMVDMSREKPTITFFKQSNNMGEVIPMVNTFAGDVNLKIFNRSIANELYAGPQPQSLQAPGALQTAGQGDSRYDGGFIDLQKRGGKDFQTHLKFKGQINAIAAGDLNKDGTIQIVTATDYQIYIYILKGSRLVVEKQLDFSASNRIISLDIADINKNGFPEIFVTSLNIHRNGLQSFVLEYNQGTYTTLTDGENYYFRVIDGKDKSKILLGQRAGNHPFHGAVFIMNASGSQYIELRKLQLPRSASVLSLAKGSVTSDDAWESVLINEHGRLTIAGDAGNIEWEGSSKFGGTLHHFLLPRNDIDASYTERVYLNPRIKFYNIDHDDKSEVFAVHNEELGGGSFGRYKRFTRGNLEILSWNGISLASVFKIRPVQGWISDFVIADIDSDGVDELVISIVGKTKLLINTKKQLSNIISYKLE